MFLPAAISAMWRRHFIMMVCNVDGLALNHDSNSHIQVPVIEQNFLRKNIVVIDSTINCEHVQ